MSNDRAASLLELLSDEQRQAYEQLLAELSSHGGDLTKLSSKDQQTLADLTRAMTPENSDIDNTDDAVLESASELTAEISEDEVVPSPKVVPEMSPTTTPFGLYVVDQLKVLCDGGSSLADAVRYGFHNKYLPVSLRDPIICQQIYQRYELEIDDITNSLQSVNREQAKEAHVLVGLAWFSTLYQCYQYVEAYGDLH